VKAISKEESIMKTRVAVLFACLCLILGASVAPAADQTASGTVTETGMSGIILKGAGGAEVKYWTGKETRYSPSDWRPMDGDKIKVAYYAKTSKKGETKLVATQVDLVQSDPNRVELKSPAAGTVREVGHTGIIVDMDATKTAIKFSTGRNTVFTPGGQKPAVGNRVKITFTRTPSKWGGGYAYIADVVDRQ
jgi:hypothetical protein